MKTKRKRTAAEKKRAKQARLSKGQGRRRRLVLPAPVYRHIEDLFKISDEEAEQIMVRSRLVTFRELRDTPPADSGVGQGEEGENAATGF